uniref:Gustatory receptor n=1 Tax=Steinernema glaseri TaxID=37863 RepID=A0A1I7XX88_9BILA
MRDACGMDKGKDPENNISAKDLIIVDRKRSGPTCTWRLDPEQRQVLKDLFKPIFVFCCYTGAYLPKRELAPVSFAFRMLFLLFISFFATYELFYLFIYVVKSADYNVTTSTTLVYLNWHFQSLLSVFFLIYWQRKGYFEEIFLKIHIPNASLGCMRTKRCIRIIFVGFISGAVMVFIVGAMHTLMIVFDKKHYSIFDLEAFNSYGDCKWIPFSFFITYYTFIFWTVAMMIYMSMTIAVYGELKYFNSRLRKLGQDLDEEERSDIGSELLEMYRTHSALTDLVRALDNTFEVYTFAMLGTNIPTTIFSLLSLFVSLKVSWYNVFFAVPSVIFCILTMIGLTAVPAKLHSAINEVQKIIYSNKAIWFPFSEKNYQIANLFISHVNQTNLGISVWGFAVVTKPLILTVIQLMSRKAVITIDCRRFHSQLRICPSSCRCDRPVMVRIVEQPMKPVLFNEIGGIFHIRFHSLLFLHKIACKRRIAWNIGMNLVYLFNIACWMKLIVISSNMLACQRLIDFDENDDKGICDRGLFVQLRTIRRVLRFMRFKFSTDVKKWEKRINYMVAALMIGIGIYHCAFTTYAVSNIDSAREPYKLASSLVVLNWTVQSIVSAFFFIRWQRSSMLRDFVRLLQVPQRFRGCHKGEKLLHRVMMCMMILIGVICTLHLTVFTAILLKVPFQLTHGALAMVKQEFYFERLAVIQPLLGLYLNVLWLVALFTYILFTTAAYLEVKEFNNRIRNLGKGSTTLLVKQLVELIDKHRTLAEAVRKLDKLFEAYAFVMIASNIPATIFSILKIATSHHISTTHLLFSIPSIMFCIVELVGLTAAPAMLHGAICKSNSLLFSNQNIWAPYRADVYQTAQSLLCHLNQTNLGVSIWGFAVVTKPLILTTLSVIVTMLAFLLEMRRNH